MDGIQQGNSRAETGYPVREMLNDAAAYRHFLRPNFLSGTRDFIAAVIRHQITGALIAVIIALGVVGAVATFWPA